MHENSSLLIQQVLLKPVSNGLPDGQQPISTQYLDKWQAALNAAALNVELSYVRPMSMGVHVLKLQPALLPELAGRAAQILSEQDEVEYAEPDQPRRRP